MNKLENLQSPSQGAISPPSFQYPSDSEPSGAASLYEPPDDDAISQSDITRHASSSVYVQSVELRDEPQGQLNFEPAPEEFKKQYYQQPPAAQIQHTSHSADFQFSRSTLRDVDEAEIRRKEQWKKEQRGLEAERQRLKELEDERVRLKEEERKLALAWEAAQQQREEKRKKRQPIAPSQMLMSARNNEADVPSSNYAYDDTYGSEFGYLLTDITFKAFMDDEYAAELIKAYYIDIEAFKNKYYHLICAVDSLWKWLHEQLRTTAFNSSDIMDKLCLAFKFPPSISQANVYSYRNYNFLIYYIREWRNDWKLIEGGTKWTAQLPLDNLWSYFIAWFLDHRLGPVLCARAHLIDMKYTFTSRPARDGGVHSNPDYGWGHPGGIHPDSIEYALKTLHESEFGVKRCKKAGHRNGDGLNYGQSTAVDEQNNKCKEVNDDGKKAECKARGKDNNELKTKQQSDGDVDLSKAKSNSTTDIIYSDEDYERLKEMINEAQKAGPTYFEMMEEYERPADDQDEDGYESV